MSMVSPSLRACARAFPRVPRPGVHRSSSIDRLSRGRGTRNPGSAAFLHFRPTSTRPRPAGLQLMTTTISEPRLRIPFQAAPRPPAEPPPPPLEVTPLQLTALLEPTLDQPADEATTPCRANDAELWFAESPADVEQAKSLCGDCPVRTACLAGALERREPWGVWGGQLLVQGAIVARKRPRGRPRKCEAAA